MKYANGIGWRICHDDCDRIIPNALVIKRDDGKMAFPDDYAAARQAEQDGVPIIHDIPGLEDWTYLDSPENRELVTRALARYPRFDCRTWDQPDTVKWTTENLIASDLVIGADGMSVEATFETWHDIAKKLGVNLEKVEEDSGGDFAYINLYATYAPTVGTLTMFFTVADNRLNDHFSYFPDAEEKKVVIETMEIACQKEFGCSLAEFVDQEDF